MIRIILIIILGAYSVNVYSQKLCGENITVNPILSANKKVNICNNNITQLVREILSVSDKCRYITRENLGELVKFLETEKNISEAFNKNTEDILSKFFEKEITYIALTETKPQQLGSLDAFTTKIVFHSSYEGASTIYIDIAYTYLELQGAEYGIKDRLSKEFIEVFNCNELDDRISRLSKELNGFETELNQSLQSQLFQCHTLNNFLEDKQRMKKILKDQGMSLFFEEQEIICNELKNRIEKIKTKKIELKEAVTQKELLDSKKPPKPPVIHRPPITPPSPTGILADKSIVTKKGALCLDEHNYYIIPENHFRSEFKGKFFIQFATLPKNYYDECDFNLFFDKELKDVFLVDRGKNISAKFKYYGLIGPFDNQKNLNEAIEYITKLKDYKSAIIKKIR